ncbi:MAG: hypothetical protein WCE82_08085 [Halobacteriota archaeon]
MEQNLTSKSVTIDELVAPSRRPTVLLGLEEKRVERVDRTRRDGT